MNDQTARTAPVVVVLPAEIDVTNSEHVHDQLVAALAPGADVVIADMTSTSFCDSSGVHALVFAHEAAVARGVRLRLAVSPEGSVPRVLQLIGVGRVLSIYSSLAEAIAAD
ncbi:MAG: STAS domain-containing protein [Trebonia sp.]|jgi:anti-anti-sigma factor